MSRFSKLSQVIWHCQCQCHIIWVLKYRYRVLKDRLAFELSKSIRAYSERLGCELVELNRESDHVHLLIKLPPKVSISTLMGAVKGKTALQVFRQFTCSPSLIRSLFKIRVICIYIRCAILFVSEVGKVTKVINRCRRYSQ